MENYGGCLPYVEAAMDGVEVNRSVVGSSPKKKHNVLV